MFSNYQRNKRLLALIFRAVSLTFMVLAFLGPINPMGADNTTINNDAIPKNYSAPLECAVHPDGNSFFVLERGSFNVREIERTPLKVIRTIPLSSQPTGLAISIEKNSLLVTRGEGQGYLSVYDLTSGQRMHDWEAGHSPCSPVFSASGNYVWICQRYSNQIQCVDMNSGKPRWTSSTLREPVSLVLSSQQKELWVANFLPGPCEGHQKLRAAISVYNADTGEFLKNILLPDGSTALRNMAISPDNQFAYVTHTLGRYHLPTTMIERGWMNTNAISILDISQQKLLATVLLDSAELGAANPWGVACSPDGKVLAVTLSGTNEIAWFNRTQLHEKLTSFADEKLKSSANTQKTAYETYDLSELANDFSFNRKIMKRFALHGKGARGILFFNDNSCVVSDYFSDQLEFIDISDNIKRCHTSFKWVEETASHAIREGEELFYSAKYCFQKWQSCSSCHPDSRSDGLTWDLLNDGIGNPKRTKSMVFAHQTSPSMSLGIRKNAELAVRAGFENIQFSNIPESEAVKVDEYLKSLRPIKSPWKTKKSDFIGRMIFNLRGCAHCHSGDLLTDQRRHLVGTTEGIDKNKPVDTPTLRESWRNAPYLNDGSARTLVEAIKNHHKGTWLTDYELRQLEIYVKGL